jgi:hypothetical protein
MVHASKGSLFPFVSAISPHWLSGWSGKKTQEIVAKVALEFFRTVLFFPAFFIPCFVADITWLSISLTWRAGCALFKRNVTVLEPNKPTDGSVAAVINPTTEPVNRVGSTNNTEKRLYIENEYTRENSTPIIHHVPVIIPTEEKPLEVTKTISHKKKNKKSDYSSYVKVSLIFGVIFSIGYYIAWALQDLKNRHLHYVPDLS